MRNAVGGRRPEGRRAGMACGLGALLLLVGIAAALAAQTALASGGPKLPARHTGGYVPANGMHVVTPYSSANDLEYHGGPVMRTNKTYAIYWQPTGYSFSTNYKTLIDQYFTDVAAASGASSNVYAVEKQYYDTTGPIAYSSTFGGSVTDTTPFPANGYSSCGGPTKCLSDAQLQAEIQSVITKQGWVKNLTTQFFLFTPNNVGSCDSPGSCSYTVFCAYHGDGSGNLIYANQPYAAYSGGCRTGQRPNGDPADDTINVTSHEHREAINDELLNAWWDDQSGNEGSDMCAWNFGNPLGGPQGAMYNQIINGNHYYLQQEWSNDGSTCLLTYGSSGNPPTVTSFSPTSGTVGTTVDVQGTNFTGATGVKFNGTADTSFVVNSATDITAHVPSGATTGPIAVTTPNGTGASSSSFTVTTSGNPPTVTSFSPTSGPVGTSVVINGTNFTGVTAVKFNGTSATSYTVNSSVKITATVPTGATTGKISVTNGSGTGTSAGTFTVTGASPPRITSFYPNYGATGAKIVISGTGFTGATSVKLASTSASFVVNSPTRITATVPSLAHGNYKWSVTTPSGTGTSTASFLHL